MQTVQCFTPNKNNTFLGLKEHYFLYIQTVYIVYIYIFVFSRAGTVHTGYRGMPHLHCFCILQLVGWQETCHPGRLHLVSGFLFCSRYWCITTDPYRLLLIHTIGQVCVDSIWGGWGLGLVQQASNGIIKAVQQGSVLMQRWRVGDGGVKGQCWVQMGGVGSGPGLQTDSWMGFGKV